eukprot:CAMPEP_0113478640 /NCGR_PEP_ID=MMETSP0014_2-20120614/20867_1 /TAXON_ID=2857 /ORGANISM="Nitzschia sp." /LENGTH=252 /DNA_ID=CAMNT_0000371851 /DNA_START=51 /DNA_END=806 /DNA_ORIENTATION=+ /assembly_acc=CAM_ASM_000159
MTSPYNHVNTFPSVGGTSTIVTMTTSKMEATADDDDTDMIDEDMDIVMPTTDPHPPVETFSSHPPFPSQPQTAYGGGAASPVSANIDAQNVYGYGLVKPSTVVHHGYGCDSLDRHSWHSKNNISSNINSNNNNNGITATGGGRSSRPQRRGSVTKFSVQPAQQAVIESSFGNCETLNAISTATTTTTTTTTTSPTHDQHHQHQQDMYKHQHQHHQYQYHQNSTMNFPRRVSEYSDDLDALSPSSTMATFASS